MAAALALIAATNASAAPGFIASTRVSGDEASTRIEVNFNCKVEYLHHTPSNNSDRIRIFLEPTAICNGVSPLAAQSRGRYRPVDADSAKLVDLEYDGGSAGGPVLILNFSEPVSFVVDPGSVDFRLVVGIRPAQVQVEHSIERPTVEHRQVPRPKPTVPDFVINLKSFERIPTVADVPNLDLPHDLRLFYSETQVDGKTWYRLRLGNFKSLEQAQTKLTDVQTIYPESWIDQIDEDSVSVDLTVATKEAIASVTGPEAPAGSKSDALMEEARQLMIAGEIARAIQIYTKVLRLPDASRHAEAQEYLALAREKNGQLAHAKAEYQRYLSLYPDTEGATRVNQRLAALLAVDQRPAGPNSTGERVTRRDNRSLWRMQTFFSQYYRRDVNQQNDQDEIVSQSALYSDVNFDARRRGERFDFSSRISVGYRNDFLDERFGSGNETRVSYAYADLADAKTGFRGRLGRQSRNTGGVLGRFDGFNLGYQARERILLNAVVGKPAYSATDGVDSERSFYGASINYGPIFENLDIGAFYIGQEIEGIEDRQAVGAEFRYFGPTQSLWGLVDYDIGFGELSSAFLQGSWRLPSRFSIHALIDRRGSPFLSAGNALIGQPVLTFAELTDIFSEDELRDLGQDRTATSTTYTVGISYPLTQRFQINADASQSTLSSTPASGGVLETPGSTYNNYSASLIASSMIKEGDVSIFGLRYSDSDTSQVLSLTLDSRFPFSRTWRVNPRLRVDRRERMGEPDYEWIFTPGIRIQYRRSQRFRVELQAGKQFVQRDTEIVNLDRESYFVNLGYQAFF